MITLNQLSISSNSENIFVDVETTLGYNITSVNLWTQDTFKDYTKAINLSYKLEQVNNKEIFIISTQDAQVSNFSGIYFIEFETDAPVEDCSTCPNPLLGIVYNLTSHYRCLTNLLTSLDNCTSCGNSYITHPDADKAMTISLMLEAINYALEVGNYTEAINILPKLKKLCNTLDCCRDIRTITNYNSGCLNCQNNANK